MASSKIEWTDSTWNPLTGCTKVSPGCVNCYAERLSRRLKAMKVVNYENGFDLAIHENSLGLPLTWKTPQYVFVNSMSDIFHEDVPIDFIQKVFDTMRKASWHIFQVLTKRTDRLASLDSSIEWPNNVWMGVSVEDHDYIYRIDHLRNIHAHIKFLSLEPLLGPLQFLDLKNIDWVIVGGESGPKSRPIEVKWVTNIRDQCLQQNVPLELSEKVDTKNVLIL